MSLLTNYLTVGLMFGLTVLLRFSSPRERMFWAVLALCVIAWPMVIANTIWRETRD